MNLRRIVTIAAATGLLAIASVTPATFADCATDGLQWPARPAVLRGTVFAGEVIAEGRTRLPSGSRYPSWRMRIDRVHAGQVSEVVTLVAVCAPISFRVGDRYLVAAGAWSDDDPDLIGLNDQTAAAWRIQGSSATLVSFGAEDPAPPWLAEPRTVTSVLALVAAGERGQLPATDAVDQAPGEVAERPEGSAGPGVPVVRVLLAWLAGLARSVWDELEADPTAPAAGR